MSRYLFVLCPPYCGSTLLWKLLCTSEHVSAFAGEGQFLPDVAQVMRESPWQADKPLPWPQIKAVWDAHWDQTKPVWLEKSPPNLVRAEAIEEHFCPAKFVIMVRNPYAHAEGLMRRNEWPVKRAANFAAMCLRTQWQNARSLSDTLVMTYESLVANPAGACDRLVDFVPALGALDYTASFQIHSVDGAIDRPITDLNQKKIDSLSPEVLRELNSHFDAHREIFSRWDYEFLD